MLFLIQWHISKRLDGGILCKSNGWKTMDEKYRKFKKLDKQQYVEVTRFLKECTHLTAREWAIARLCADFRTTTNRAEMTWCRL